MTRAVREISRAWHSTPDGPRWLELTVREPEVSFAAVPCQASLVYTHRRS